MFLLFCLWSKWKNPQTTPLTTTTDYNLDLGKILGQLKPYITSFFKTKLTKK